MLPYTCPDTVAYSVNVLKPMPNELFSGWVIVHQDLHINFGSCVMEMGICRRGSCGLREASLQVGQGH